LVGKGHKDGSFWGVILKVPKGGALGSLDERIVTKVRIKVERSFALGNSFPMLRKSMA